MTNKFSKKLQSASTIILILLMASVTLLAMPPQPVQAQLATEQPVSGQLPTGVTPSLTVNIKAYLSFRPNPVGVGQTILVNMWTTPAINPHRLHQGYKVTITMPDGTKDVYTMNSYCADATAWFEYVADQLGTWKIKFEFPGEYYPAGQYYNGYIVTNTSGNYLNSAYYVPASTGEQELVVQENQVLSWPPSPLPTDYWTRPAHLENREWWPILGNYPADGVVGGGPTWPADTNTYMSNYCFIPYVQAPNTAHIVWKRLGSVAGLIGGIAGQYGSTSSPDNPSVVYAGRCYQTYTKPGVGSVAACYDLRTGEIYYEIPTAQGGVTPSAISYGRSTNVAVPGATESSTYAVSLMSIGTRLMKIDPYSGAVTLNVTGISATSNTFYSDPYVLSMQTLGSGTNTKYCLVNWTTAGTEANFTARIVSNITLAWILPVFPTTAAMGGTSRVYDFEAGVAIWSLGIPPLGAGALYGTWIRAASMTTGAELWNITVEDTRYSSASILADHGKLVILMQNGYWMAWDSYSGKFLWKSELMDYPWGAPSFGAYAAQSAYGLFYRQSYDGVYAFNWTNGKIVWHYKAASEPYETPYAGDLSFNAGGIIADGKLYTYNTEHTPSWPRTRGWKLHCINATTGEGIWNITGSQAPGAIADGYLTTANGDDGYMYVYGKGQSATTVSAPQTAITQGQSIILIGTVLDQSPAQPGTACVSKESMKTQMEYLHMQLPIGGIWGNETITGVPVSIDAVDPNGNYVHIADVTSDVSGTFSYVWTPDLAGKYTVTATFMGDDSYGSSWAETAVGVVQAPAATAAPTATPVQQSPTDMYLAGSTIAIIIAIAIVGLLLLRKRP